MDFSQPVFRTWPSDIRLDGRTWLDFKTEVLRLPDYFPPLYCCCGSPTYKPRNYPTRDEIRASIERIDDFYTDAIRFKYSDFVNDFVCERRLEMKFLRMSDMKKEIELCIDDLVESVVKKYEEIAVKEAYRMSCISVSTEKVNEVIANIKMIGGKIDYADGEIKVPISSMHRISVNMPTTDFADTKKRRTWRNGYDGTDIPPVTDVQTYNNRVVKVTFADGSFTKAVCSENDNFDLDVGISVCITKRMMGKDGHKLYNNMMRKVHDQMVENAKREVKLQALETELKRQKRKDELKAAAKKAKARQEQIDIQKTAMVEALHAFKTETGDDMK